MLTKGEERLFRELLNPLIKDHYNISRRELSMSHKYIFGVELVPPFFTNKELYESVTYLEEIVRSEKLKDLEGLRDYFKKKGRELDRFIDKLIADNPPPNPSEQ